MTWVVIWLALQVPLGVLLGKWLRGTRRMIYFAGAVCIILTVGALAFIAVSNGAPKL